MAVWPPLKSAVFSRNSCPLASNFVLCPAVRICWKLVLLPSFFSLLRKFFSPSPSPSLNLLMKELINEWPFLSFSSFNRTLSDFWVIPKSNGWNSFRSRAEIKCSFCWNLSPEDRWFPKALIFGLGKSVQKNLIFLLKWLYKVIK